MAASSSSAPLTAAPSRQDRPPLSAHKSLFNANRTSEKAYESLISTAAALAHGAHNHGEISETEQSGAQKNGEPDCSIRLRVQLWGVTEKKTLCYYVLKKIKLK